MTREEAIKWFRENPFYHKDHEPFNLAIKALEQEPKTGHRVSGDLLGGSYCSECMTCLKDYFKYCPNCGTRMAESEDKE